MNSTKIIPAIEKQFLAPKHFLFTLIKPFFFFCKYSVSDVELVHDYRNNTVFSHLFFVFTLCVCVCVTERERERERERESETNIIRVCPFYFMLKKYDWFHS